MADSPDLDGAVEGTDPVGSTETRKVQQLGRVDVPDEYLRNIGVEEGEKVFVVCEEDSVRIVKATSENIL